MRISPSPVCDHGKNEPPFDGTGMPNKGTSPRRRSSVRQGLHLRNNASLARAAASRSQFLEERHIADLSAAEWGRRGNLARASAVQVWGTPKPQLASKSTGLKWTSSQHMRAARF